MSPRPTLVPSTSDGRVVTAALAMATTLAIARLVVGFARGEPYDADLALAMIFALVGIGLLAAEARESLEARSSRGARHRTIER